MKKKSKLLLITGASLLLLGCLFFGGVMMSLGWDFTKLSTTKYETATHQVTDDYRNIRIESDTAEILFLSSGDDTTTVLCHEEKNAKHTVTVENGTLTVKLKDTRKWYEHIGISFDAPRITVYLPSGSYGLLSVAVKTGGVTVPADFSFEGTDIETSTGDVTLRAAEAGEAKITTETGAIRVENVRAAVLSLSVSTGDVTVTDTAVSGPVTVKVSTGKTTLTDLSCRSLYSDGSTGKLTLENTFVRDKIKIKRSTGDVLFSGCDATEIYVRTTTGSVRGSLASPKDFDAHSDTGRVCVPDTTTGGRCEIKADTGDIHITLD